MIFFCVNCCLDFLNYFWLMFNFLTPFGIDLFIGFLKLFLILCKFSHFCLLFQASSIRRYLSERQRGEKILIKPLFTWYNISKVFSLVICLEWHTILLLTTCKKQKVWNETYQRSFGLNTCSPYLPWFPYL